MQRRRSKQVKRRTNVSTPRPIREFVRTDRQIQRTRYCFLAGVASSICDLLEREGVKSSEGCLVRRIAEDMWNRDNGPTAVCDAPEQPRGLR